MNTSNGQEHWKEKKRRHDRWIQNAKTANKVIDVPHTPDKDPTRLFSNPHQFPTCTCKDDGDRCLFYEVNETGKTYRIYIVCVLCLQKGNIQVAWDPIGEEIITFIFSRHFYQ